jgi:hypothetical protein
MTSNTTDNSHKFDLDTWQNGPMTSFEQTCFAEYWDKLPKVVQDKMTVDPYNFYHRMALGKYLIENTGDCWGERFEEHWFWAYLALLDWEWRSGRLSAPPALTDYNNSNNKKTKKKKKKNHHPVEYISPDSWWSYMNLGFSVCVYLGASKAGLVPAITLSTTSHQQTATTNISIDKDPHFQKQVDHWYDFFQTHHIPFLKRRVDLAKNPTAIFPFYRHLWESHTATLDTSLIGAKHLEALLPEEDRRFGLGWCGMVEIMEAMGWSHLSLTALMKVGAGRMPSRRLDDTTATNNALEYLKEHRPREYETCQNMFRLQASSSEDLQGICKFWKRISVYPQIQKRLPGLLETLGHGSFGSKTAVFLLMLVHAAIPKSLVEFSFWGLVVALVVTMIYAVVHAL